jgi:predicted N-acyltransferase
LGSGVGTHAEVYPLYLAVHERSPFKFETLTKNYFRAIGQRMPERARFFVWRQSEKIVAFSFSLVCDDAIYDECIGLDYRVALDLHLYFYTCAISPGRCNKLNLLQQSAKL